MDLVVIILLLAAAVGCFWAWPSQSPPTDAEDLCPNCGYDLRGASTGRCPECGTPFHRSSDHIPLRDDWPSNPIAPRRPRPDESPVIVHLTDEEFQARTLRDQFEARGIAAQVQAPASVPMNPYSLATEVRGGWRVVVWSDDVDLATAIRDKLIPPPPKGPESPDL